ncbi:MAG: hypothetical protein FWD52_09785 [Candidatus Bathyarchaeota archaeon]|nr:hypothetical protein [Candidatus Termiticorpusculum sp.]
MEAIMNTTMIDQTIEPTNNKTYVTVEIQVPANHFAVVGKVSDLFGCKPDAVFQKALNHALKTGVLGHVLEAMLNEKYRHVFNCPQNTHDLTL